jgi:hypothetical protein
MSWINPKTWVTGELVTAAMLNKEIRDRLNDLWKYQSKGDILVATGASDVVRLPVGTNGQVLKANSSKTQGIEWGTCPAVDLIAARGDLIVGAGADVATRLPIGAAGRVLTVDPGEGQPQPAWRLDPVIDMATAKGDLFVATAADTVQRLPLGADGLTLVVDGAQATGMKWGRYPFAAVTGLWDNPAWSTGSPVSVGVYTYQPSQWNLALSNDVQFLHFSIRIQYVDGSNDNELHLCPGTSSVPFMRIIGIKDTEIYHASVWMPLSNSRFTLRVINTDIGWTSIYVTGYIP